MTPRSGHGWQKLQALVVAIDAAAEREPYPRLAKLMQSLAIQQTGAQAGGARPTFG
jgi:hypothetical protein